MPRNFETSRLVFATFALILLAATMAAMQGAMAAGEIIATHGSASPYGTGSWTPDTLTDAPATHPQTPVMPIWTLPWVVGPGDGGNPDPGGPNWVGWGALAIVGIAVIIGALTAASPATPPAPATPVPEAAPAPQTVPTPVSTPVPTPDNNPQHRGRLQIQGNDLRRESSWPWALPAPPKKTIALAELTLLWNQLSRTEQQLRTRAYAQTQSFIQRGPHYAELFMTYQNNNLPTRHRDARIDVEIRKGIAFVD